MARLASQAKMGYYPTPPGIVEHIKQALVLPGPGTYRFLDTCCGEGEALAQLTHGLSSPEIIVETYGFELDESRYKASAQKLHNVLWGDALNEMFVSSKAFSLLFLNPPYDWDDGQRLEALFLEAHLRFLALQGWLVFVIPHRALTSVTGILTNKFADLSIFAFPEPDFAAFKQLVIVGRRWPVRDSDEQKNRILQLGSMPAPDAWEALPKTDEMSPGSLVLPPSPDMRLIWSSERLDMMKAAAVVRKSPAWKDLEAVTAAKTLNDLRPLAPLRHGHLAMLLAGGMMDGEVEANGRRLIIKGSVRKRVDSQVETTETHVVETHTERFEIVIRAIDPGKQEIFAIK